MFIRFHVGVKVALVGKKSDNIYFCIGHSRVSLYPLIQLQGNNRVLRYNLLAGISSFVLPFVVIGWKSSEYTSHPKCQIDGLTCATLVSRDK